MSSVGARIASGAAWMVLFRGLERLIGIVSMIILARLLLPADFGMIAMAMSFVAILELLWTFGFDSALIQQKDAGRSFYDTAWTLNVGLGLSVGLGLIALAHPAAAFYGDDRLVPLIYCLALGSLFQGFENVGVVAFRKELRFGTEFVFQISKKMAGFLVTIPLAFVLRNYWALAAGMVASRLVSLILSYVAHPFRPRPSLAERKSLVGFSKWLLLNNVLFALQTRSQDFMIGKLAGANGLGLYNLAYEISTLPSTAIVYPINRAVFPGFSQLAHDPDALVRAYLRVLGAIALLILPAGLGIAATAELLVPTVLGAKWLDAIPLIKILACFGSIAALSSVFGPTFMALGRARVLTVFTAVNVALFIPGLIYGTLTAGLIGAAWASLAVVAIMMPASHWLAARTLKVRLSEIVGHLWRPTIASLVMYAAVRSVVAMLDATGSPGLLVVKSTAAVSLGIAVYLGVLVGLWLIAGRPQGTESMVLDELTMRIRKRRVGIAGTH